MAGRRSWLLVLVLAVALGGCDQLGGKKDSADKETSADEDDSKKKKKKKKKKADDEEEEEEEEASAKPTAEPTATATATAEPAATAEPSATVEAAATASASADPAATGDVKRYKDEVPDSGKLAISNPVTARKEANTTSETIVVIQPGSEVTRVARLGPYTLVSWKSKTGDKFGWIETSKAQKHTDLPDAGVVAKPDAAKKPDSGRPEFGLPSFKKDGGR
jgi:hypothetical protein